VVKRADVFVLVEAAGTKLFRDLMLPQVLVTTTAGAVFHAKCQAGSGHLTTFLPITGPGEETMPDHL
jgi:hypothetical protein